MTVMAVTTTKIAATTVAKLMEEMREKEVEGRMPEAAATTKVAVEETIHDEVRGARAKAKAKALVERMRKGEVGRGVTRAGVRAEVTVDVVVKKEVKESKARMALKRAMERGVRL